MRLFNEPEAHPWVWKVRQSSLGVIAYVPGEPLSWEGWETLRRRAGETGAYLTRICAS